MGSVVFFAIMFLTTGFFHIKNPTEFSTGILVLTGFFTAFFFTLWAFTGFSF